MEIKAQVPHLIIKPRHGFAALNLQEIVTYWDLLLALASRDVKLRYRQTALGVLWVIFQPLISAGIFSFVFGKVGKFPSDGVPYFLFSFAGLVGWNVFQSTLTKVSNCMVGNANLVSKVYFPRLVLPLSTVFSTMIDFLVAMLLTVVLMGVYHVVPTVLGAALLPVILVLLLVLAVGVGLFCTALMVTYRDIQFILPVIIPFVLYASPVAYSVSSIPAHLHWIYYLNPLASLLEAFRWSLLGTGNLNAGAFGYAAIMSIIIFLGGAFYFQKTERRFADVI